MRNLAKTLCLVAGMMLLGGGSAAQAEVRSPCVYRWVAVTRYRTVSEVVYVNITVNGRTVVVPRIVYKQVPYTVYLWVKDCGNPT